MKKLLCLLLLVSTVTLCLFSCESNENKDSENDPTNEDTSNTEEKEGKEEECSHEWKDRTCTTPYMCKLCGKTFGEALGHDYSYDGKCYNCNTLNPIITETLSKCSLITPSLPKESSDYSYLDTPYSTVKVTRITYQFSCTNDGKIGLDVWFSGEKIYDWEGNERSSASAVGWKLFDSDGNVVTSGTFYSPSIQVGETFGNQKESILSEFDNAVPGQYRLEIINVN